MSAASSTRRGVAPLVAVLAIGAIGALAPFGDSDREEHADTERAVAGDAIDVQAEARRASRAMARLELFRTGNGGQTLTLAGDDVTAVLRHFFPGLVPPGVSGPVVGLAGGVVRLTARVSADAFPTAPFLAKVLQAFPDTVDVELYGTLASDRSGLSLRVDRMSMERVPLPAAVVASIIASLSLSSSLPSVDAGNAAGGAEAAPTLRLAWPRDLAGVHVRNDRLILERAEPALERVVDGGGGA